MAESSKVAAFLLLLLYFSAGSATAQTPDWVSHLLEWAFGMKAAVGDAPSAGWMEPKPAPDFRLVDQDGRGITLQDYRGKVVLVNFITTDCGNSCSSMKELKILAKTLGGKMGKEVVFLSISLDPARDSPEALKAFGQRWGIRSGWKLLTGSTKAVEELASAYGVYVKRIEANPTNHHQNLEYGDVVIFLDQEGRLRKRILPHLLQLSGREDVEWLLKVHDH